MSSAPPEAGASLELGLAAGLTASIAAFSDQVLRLADAYDRSVLEWEDCHPVPLVPIANAAAGSLIDERWQVRKGWAWQVMLITVTFGAGATSATAYETGDSTGLLPSNALRDFLPDTAGVASWEPKGLILMGGAQLAMSSAGGGITAVGRAVEIRLSRLPAYLM